ncbi:MAG: hypothetical protein KGI30_08680 [Planctomycetota bacterium]|nr:hypothetical protein [Planctomycetota bacterium]
MLGWVGLGWVGLGWVGLGWVGLGWVGKLLSQGQQTRPRNGLSRKLNRLFVSIRNPPCRINEASINESVVKGKGIPRDTGIVTIWFF